jgi:hypothetical protein
MMVLKKFFDFTFLVIFLVKFPLFFSFTLPTLFSYSYIMPQQPRKRKVYELQGNYHVFNLNRDMKFYDENPNSGTSTANNYYFAGSSNSNELHKNLTLDAELLSDNSDKTRKAIRNKKKGIVKIPRPPNAFIIYRREMKAKIDFCKKTEAEISKEVGKMWRKEPEEIKDMYYKLADHAKEKHQEKYAGYRYQPERGKGIQIADTSNRCNKKDDEPDEPESVHHTESPPAPEFNDNNFETVPNFEFISNFETVESAPDFEPIPEFMYDIHLPNFAYYMN